ncbi:MULTISPECIES: GcvT family protein [Pseudofrankia]|uniref:GcvT family protein n=1 Tax=Pseudofrankia TaxID=2994363 RepID=UPI000234BC97|nr:MULTISPECIES: FAD-dependent oxidoreductase [Pseudofrankia]OHV30081.1 sarcosine dehydrogenase [Pseudofrankia sp. EUN1h]
MSPRLVIIGAGIVGCALADELTGRGWTDVTVLDRGPLFRTGGSTSHAPGLVFQVNPSRTMAGFARYTVEKYLALGCFDQVGSIEVATTPERLAELHRRHGFALAWGIGARVLSPAECHDRFPLLDPAAVLGGLHVPTDGLARAVDAARAQARAAIARGAVFHGHQEVTAIEDDGVRVGERHVPADLVVCCAGYWGPGLAPVPLLPLAHQYAVTGAVNGLPTGLPILRHQDRDLYFRETAGRLGIGSYAHDPMPTAVEPPFEVAQFAASLTDARAVLPGLPDVEHGINGIFSFTPDGFPLLGPVEGRPGLWLAEAVWVTHSAGVARAVAEWLVDGRPAVDLHECDTRRFEEAQRAPSYIDARARRAFVEVYDIVHPLDPVHEPRPLRVSPFYARQLALGARFTEGAGWERPLWYEANAGLSTPDLPPRDAWAARHWSPIVAAEAMATRERAGLFDLTPLKRLAVTGPGAAAFLQRMCSNHVDRPVGAVAYALLLDEGGGVRSDVTVARLGEHEFQVGVNGHLDLAWLRAHAPAGVHIADITGATCCVGVWGPAARDLLAPLTTLDLSHEAFGYFTARRTHLDAVPVTMLRVSYVGELGWEVYASAELGLRLWDTLWTAGQALGAVAAGRGALTSMRVEKGYRAWGVDMTAQDDPYSAGLGFAVDLRHGDFLGRAALGRADVGPDGPRALCCLTVDDGRTVPMGREPVLAGDAPVGHVTSAAYGYGVRAPIAYAWLPGALATPGEKVEIAYFDQRVGATVRAEPLFDPKGTRIRR